MDKYKYKYKKKKKKKKEREYITSPTPSLKSIHYNLIIFSQIKQLHQAEPAGEIKHATI